MGACGWVGGWVRVGGCGWVGGWVGACGWLWVGGWVQVCAAARTHAHTCPQARPSAPPLPPHASTPTHAGSKRHFLHVSHSIQCSVSTAAAGGGGATAATAAPPPPPQYCPPAYWARCAAAAACCCSHSSCSGWVVWLVGGWVGRWVRRREARGTPSHTHSQHTHAPPPTHTPSHLCLLDLQRVQAELSLGAVKQALGQGNDICIIRGAGGGRGGGHMGLGGGGCVGKGAMTSA